MSWEIMSSDTKPCECGKGTVTHVMEMDDWNRIRNSMEIHCPDCRKMVARRADAQRRKDAKRERLFEQAKRLAIKRYLEQWLDGYNGLTSKAAWQRYTGGSGYQHSAPFTSTSSTRAVSPSICSGASRTTSRKCCRRWRCAIRTFLIY